MECPACQGTGELPDPGPDDPVPAGLGPYPGPVQECGACDGTGEVEDLADVWDD